MEDCWRTVQQMPYDASLPLDQIKDNIKNELLHHILYPMGFRKVQDTNKNGEDRSWSEQADDGKIRELYGLYR